MHPLQHPAVIREVERTASTHLGFPWHATGFTNLDDLASHPCGLFSGTALTVFAKLGDHDHFTAELQGLSLLRPSVRVPTPVATGIAQTDSGTLLLLEAEAAQEARTDDHWRSIGTTLATLHDVQAEHFGNTFDGFFGPLPQDNRPVTTNTWPDFYAERRLTPRLRSAVDSGHLPPDLAKKIEALIHRLPTLCGPEPTPSLLHGDAQQNNWLTTPTGAVLIDTAPYFGHPEIDLALLDYFEPVPAAAFEAYKEIRPIDPGFAERRELWRLYGYLAVVTVDGDSAFGRPFLAKVAEAIDAYR
ncbi:fructosamine kinase family protein [Kribbella sp. NBC_01245]|uniref:fructosamine kinase family protein n=1 Tax=Kribbella sp. NBC_01245 TaxID=2903578 RepID=UPI002E2B17A9|nr:fructosamine kinase family protein [Kribbella sp. NBC_01245]